MNSSVTFVSILGLFLVFSLTIVEGRNLNKLSRSTPPPRDDSTLVLTNILFRHGDRTPNSAVYSSNPYNNVSFYKPYGWGQLTKDGKRTEYKLGTSLRQRYNKFLGDVYSIDYIDARTTNVDRTKMSLQLMLAGLWPPTRSQRWNIRLNWQPIPYNYFENDKELSSNTVCKKFDILYEENYNRNETQALLAKNQWLYTYLSTYSNKTVASPEDVFTFYFELTAQMEFGYPVEDWIPPVWKDIEKVTKDAYYLSWNTTALRKLAGGFLIRKIIQDAQAKINGTLTPNERKLFAYSAHERNIALFLGTLGLYPDDIPAYGSHVLLELHLKNGIYGFEIYYQDWKQRNPKLLTLSGCTAFCPIDKFVALLSDVLPVDDDC